MSHGALSAEAHETLAMGMNRIKGHLVAEKAEKMLKDSKFYLMVIARTQESNKLHLQDLVLQWII